MPGPDSGAGESTDGVPMSWDFSTEPEFAAKLDWAREFVRDEIYPLEVLDLDHAEFRRLAAPLQQRVKEQGLWAAHLGPELGGQGYGQLRLGLLHEILGTSELAPFAFGCQAPDSGNIELLALAGTPEQKARWMRPLLDGEVLSAFSMTEQGTGSDPRQFTTTARLVDGQWVLNGGKWFVGNASRADFHIVMAVTEPDAPARARMSMLIVPTDAEGIETREIGLMNDPDHKHPVWSHCEVSYRDVRVPAENLLGDRGEAFTLAQKRLGPGRIHHCMRWIGVCRRAFDMLCERAVSIDVHGGPLADKQTVQNWVADCAAAIESARLLTLHAAWKIDQVGASAARTEIAMIKYHGAAVLHDVIDKAVQVHGSLGFSTDMPLEQMYRWARAARIYDGPDEVHRVSVARRLLREYSPTPTPSEHVPTRRASALERFREQLDVAAVLR
ncbi:acyl-CoA dehydrogenase family protein [Saccharopolyspora sp. TS4A08]|uniref:Acyl-CoA dehydrogenase family protein n=1 Tax=Saccharopolyspora ipomoeae TaxID=3042027 RepID=A0ABT6PS63_9PSEU|nr:acyl-CoA dehydrogenase family protein [Saccharopolyspora sp. TS4A08]MDI2030488.1 acyl-CoA dehydrogenase family protein [Saccharopolyspora sp. TS4A08]